jgi:hypothetical protein
VVARQGIGHAAKLRELEEQREANRAEWQKLGPRIEEAGLQVQHLRSQAQQRISAEQAPTLAKVAELEELRREKVRQEFEQQKRQQAEKKAERERAGRAQGLPAMAAKREMKASGWSDRGEQWKAAPEGLKKLIDGYNAAPKEMRARHPRPHLERRPAPRAGARAAGRAAAAVPRQRPRHGAVKIILASSLTRVMMLSLTEKTP